MIRRINTAAQPELVAKPDWNVMLIKIAGFILCLLGLSVAPATTRDSGQANQGDVIEGCRLDLSADKERYEFGEPITLHIRISNVGQNEIDYFGEGYCGYRVEVFLPEVVVFRPKTGPSPLTLWGDEQAHPEKTSDAGGSVLRGKSSLEELTTLNRAFDMTLSGTYGIVVHRMIMIPGDSQAGSYVDVPSNKIFLEISDPAN
jgi:hypothetical protein